MRSQDKQLGPERIPTQSIGIYRHISFEDSTEPYMTEQKAQMDEEGDLVIKNTIQWIIKRVRISSDNGWQSPSRLTYCLRETM
jgi:hypothetical protein